MRKKCYTLSRLSTVSKSERVLMSYHYLQKMGACSNLSVKGVMRTVIE